jgi:cytidyltransferase-like protein
MANENYTIEDNYQKMFIPQRTQPPHIGHISMLEAACREAGVVIIGIGSANKYDAKNPYFAVEREMMLKKSLEDKGLTNYRFVHAPDLGSDEEWKDYVARNAGVDKYTKIVSGNDWVEKIFAGYEVISSYDIIPEQIDISATKLRQMIVDENPEWKRYAATGTLYYFEKFGGKDRIARFVDHHL